VIAHFNVIFHGGGSMRWRRIWVLVGVTVLALSGTLGVRAAHAATSRGAVTITSDNDFLTCGCVTAGIGTPADPYVIGPYQIGSPSPTGGYAIKIDGVTKSFTIAGVSIGYNDSNSGDPVIWLVNVNGTQANPIVVSGIDANNDGTGVKIENSSYIALDNLNINKMNGTGISLDTASHVSLSNSKLKATATGQLPHTEDGLYALNSSYITIGGGTDCPKSQICNSFDYDSGWGVYLQGSSNVMISYASANADDTGGFILDGSSNVKIENSTSQADGPICLSVGGQKISSGYISDLQGGVVLINGSSDNVISNDAFAADKGYDIGSGGNGFFSDPCDHMNDPFSPVEAPQGSDNTFTNTCYKTTDIAGLPPNPCN
jgi:hypothetical protein